MIRRSALEKHDAPLEIAPLCARRQQPADRWLADAVAGGLSHLAGTVRCAGRCTVRCRVSNAQPAVPGLGCANRIGLRALGNLPTWVSFAASQLRGVVTLGWRRDVLQRRTMVRSPAISGRPIGQRSRTGRRQPSFRGRWAFPIT